MNSKSLVSEIKNSTTKNETLPSKKSDFKLGSGKNILPIQDGAVSD